VAVIDGDRDVVTGLIPVPSRPWAVAVIPETNRVYVMSQESRALSVTDGGLGTVVATVDVRTRACGVATNPRTNRVYVTSLDASAVTVVCRSSTPRPGAER
jgi:DNA-binding beta-propeller fold protein YncE